MNGIKFLVFFLAGSGCNIFTLFMAAKRLIDRGIAAKAAMGMIMGGGAVILL